MDNNNRIIIRKTMMMITYLPPRADALRVDESIRVGVTGGGSAAGVAITLLHFATNAFAAALCTPWIWFTVFPIPNVSG